MNDDPARSLVRLVRDEGRAVLATLTRTLGDLGLAEDAVQDAITTIAARGIDGLDRPGAYLRTVVINECRRRMRQRKPRPGDTSAGDEHLDEHDVEMLDVLRSLSSRKRTAIVLRYYEQLSEAEIADVLGISVGTVKSQASRALAGLRARAPRSLDPRGDDR